MFIVEARLKEYLQSQSTAIIAQCANVSKSNTPANACSKSTIKPVEEVRNMFKVNNKDTIPN